MPLSLDSLGFGADGDGTAFNLGSLGLDRDSLAKHKLELSRVTLTPTDPDDHSPRAVLAFIDTVLDRIDPPRRRARALGHTTETLPTPNAPRVMTTPKPRSAPRTDDVKPNGALARHDTDYLVRELRRAITIRNPLGNEDGRRGWTLHVNKLVRVIHSRGYSVNDIVALLNGAEPTSTATPTPRGPIIASGGADSAPTPTTNDPFRTATPMTWDHVRTLFTADPRDRRWDLFFGDADRDYSNCRG